MLEGCLARLGEAGFKRYEVSAYARPGQECQHNLNYWRFGDYLGVGAGAHGKLSEPDKNRIVRTQQLREPRRYMAAMEGDPAAALSSSEVPEDQRPFEFMLNALRQPEGFEVNIFQARTGLSWDRVARTIASLQQQGLVDYRVDDRVGNKGTRCFPTPRGLLFLNDVLLRFLP
jgi:oxygen-independent coproporphyrinogen-3 oxidase